MENIRNAGAEQDPGFIIKEEFTDNSMGWPEQNDNNAKLEIQDGKYRIHCISPVNAKLAGITPKGLNYSGNYTVETLLRKSGGMENNSYGIFWAGKDAGSHYRFEITGNGLMAVYSCEDYKALTPYIGWIQKSAINRSNAANKFSIMKMNQHVHFFMNGKYLASLQGQFYFGKQLGFITQPEMAVEAEYFHVMQGLNKDLVAVLPEVYTREVVQASFDNIRARYDKAEQSLSLNIMYTLTDALAAQPEATVEIRCKIQRGDEAVYSDYFEEKITLGNQLTMTTKRSPVVLEEGKYFLQVQMQYQDKVIQEFTRITII